MTDEIVPPPRGAIADFGPDANTIVGLLADPDRRRLLAALELGATTLEAAAAATRLPDHRASKALGKLVDSGLVLAGSTGNFTVDGAAFSRAARVALARPPSDEHAAEPAATKRVLDAFVRQGRIVSMPTAPAKRKVVLEWLARKFEPGHRFPESAVNTILDGHADDPAALRRYLVDEGLLDRADGRYWRSGGPLDDEPS